MRKAIPSLVLALVSCHTLPPQTALELVDAIPLPSVEGRIDHMAVDPFTRRLFLAALGNNTVEVLDLARGVHLQSLAGFREPQGIATLPDRRMIAVANGRGEGAQLIDAGDFHNVRMVQLGEDADNVRYDAAAQRFFVGFGGGALAAVSVDGAVLGQVALPGHPESFQLERDGGRAFINVPTARSIVVIDRVAMRVMAGWPVADAKANYPMALDEASHRLFIGCREPARVLVFDTTTGKEIDSFRIVSDTDDLFWDAVRKRLYVSGGEGYVDVFQEDEQSRFSRIAMVRTGEGARTSLFDREESRLYVAVPHRGRQQAEVRIYQAH